MKPEPIYIDFDPDKDNTKYMRFKVLNRDQVEANQIPTLLGEDYVLISISCPNDPADIPDNQHCKEILRLEFDDLDTPLSWAKCKLFQKEQAVKILDFFNKYRISCPLLVVHCDAGISRSPAVAAALTKIQGHGDSEYFSHYIPNRRVYSFLMNEFYSKQENL